MNEGYAQKIEMASDSAGTLLGFGFSFTLLINLIVGSRMNKLLGSVKNLQLIVHLTLMNVVIPANAQMLNSVIFEWVTFDLFDTEALTALYFSSSDPEVDDSLEQLGYGSAFCLVNLGSCLYIICLQLVIVLLELLFLACFRLNCWHRRSDKVS